MIRRAVDIRRLRYFIAVAEELHFTRAAARLHVAQPALSQQIRELERSLGTTLFLRSKRWVQLTEAGTVLLPEARRIVEQSEAAARAVQRAGKGEMGALAVGFTPSAAGDLIPRAVNEYRSRFPQVEVSLRVATSSQQIRMLLEDELHVGLARDVGFPKGLAVQRLRREEYVVALPRRHRLAPRARVAVAELAGEPFVLGPGPSESSSDVVFSACRDAGFAPRVVQQTADTTTALVLIAAGAGVTLMPRSSGHLATHDVVYRPIRGRRVTDDLFVAWRRQRTSPITSAFVDIIRGVGGAPARAS